MIQVLKLNECYPGDTILIGNIKFAVVDPESYISHDSHIASRAGCVLLCNLYTGWLGYFPQTMEAYKS